MKTSDKVICVNAKNINGPERFSDIPVEGRIYTVRGVDTSPSASEPPGIYLVGIVGAVWRDGSEFGFLPSRFRRITPRSESASIVQHNKEITGA
jgi:hypothetical protein